MKFLINIICASIISLSLALGSYVFAQQYTRIELAKRSSINELTEKFYTELTTSEIFKAIGKSKYYRNVERLLITPISESILEINLHIERIRHESPKRKKRVSSDAKLSYMSYEDFYLLCPKINFQPAENFKISASMMFLKSSDDFHFEQNVLTYYSVNMNLSF